MSEVNIKRVPLLQSTELSTHALKKTEKPKPPPPRSFRFDLTLSEPTDTKCAEFNYAQLLKNAEKNRKKEKKKEKVASNGSDPFNDEAEDDEQVKNAAKYFEAKYGKAKLKNGDIDLGAGYDESDSFIDNTDAYDEIVPEEVTTAHGGFYVNSGPLEFKASDKASNSRDDDKDDEDDDEEEDDDEDDSSEEESDELSDEEEISKKLKKRSLSSSDNEDQENSKSPPKNKQKVEVDNSLPGTSKMDVS